MTSQIQNLSSDQALLSANMKDKKFPLEDLGTHLVSYTLNQLTESISGEPEAQEPQLEQESSSSHGLDAVFGMVRALNLSMMMATTSNQSQTQDQLAIGASIQAADMQNVQTAEQDIQQYKDEMNSWWHRMLHDVFKVITPVLKIVNLAMMGVAAATGQWEFVILGVSLMALTKSGALGDMAQGLSDVISDCGCSSETAKVIADVLVTLTVVTGAVVLSFGGGAAEVAEDAATAAEDAGDIEMTDFASKDTAEVKGEESKPEEKEKPQSSKLKKILKSVGKAIGMGTMGLAASTENTHLINDIVNDTDLSQKDKDRLQFLLEILMDVTILVGGITGAVSAFASVGAESTTKLSSAMNKVTEMLGEGLAKILPETMEFFGDNASLMKRVAQGAQVAVKGFEGLTELGISSQQMFEAYVENNFTEVEGAIMNSNVDFQINEAMLSKISSNLKTTMKGFEQMTNHNDYFAALDAVGYALLDS